MEIAYIYPAFINIGGADKIIISKANYMADHWGYEVFLITDSQNGIEPFFPLSKKVHLVDLDINFFQQYQYGPLKRLMVYLRLMRRYKKALTQTLAQIQPDIVISTFSRDAKFVNLYKRYAKFPIVDYYINVDKLEWVRNKITVHMDCKRPAISHDVYYNCYYNKDIYDTIFKKKWDYYNNRPFENISALMYAARKVINSDDSRIETLGLILKKVPYGAIVFYNFDYELELIKQACDYFNISYTQWNGHVHEEPKLGEKHAAYLVQYTAGCEGWECTSTSDIIFYSQTYSYKVLKQAKGRIDRINTPHKDLYYHHLISDAPLDKAITKCLKRKEKFNETNFILDAGGDI